MFLPEHSAGVLHSIGQRDTKELHSWEEQLSAIQFGNLREFCFIRFPPETD